MGKKRGSTVTRGARGSQQQNRKQPQGRIARLREFVRGVRSELRKVSWPNREQLRQSTLVVIIIVLTLGVYVAAWDFVFGSLARLIFS
ncbi:MAG: preprotein translocase subunit SecE [Actinomycetota bacterium]|nr:preprotein translocase subunit SecE [Actinomycetota bacterium]HZY66545.1 preprotein translocase subunit SecE [Rubrobacteraceae bacterium]